MGGKSMAGRRVLVTGASSGIGLATAVALAAEGAHVTLAARRHDLVAEAVGAIREAGGYAIAADCDLRSSDDVARLAAGLERHGLDHLVANAGVLGPVARLADVAERDWDEVVATNLTANQRLLRHLDPMLSASGDGRAVFVSSGAANGDEMWPTWGPYAVTKAALDALARTYAAEAPSVAVTILNPGPVRTAMRALAAPDEDPGTLRGPEAVAGAILRLLAGPRAGSGLLYDLEADAFRRFRGVA